MGRGQAGVCIWHRALKLLKKKKKSSSTVVRQFAKTFFPICLRARATGDAADPDDDETQTLRATLHQ